jgi:BolA protein
VSTVVDRIKERLTPLAPERLQIDDDSAKHAGHAGAAGGGHYRLLIVSQQFAGKSPIARHRMVYDLLGDLMQQGIHALSIKAYTPDEPSR